jgi:glyoxylase-like metal-dependent hydrolase (beta-lactamase superfamily II)
LFIENHEGYRFILQNLNTMIYFKKLTFNPFQENTWIIWNEVKDCVILDPGCADQAEETILAEFITSNSLKPQAIWLTHAHVDHVLGLNFCQSKWKIPYFLHREEVPVLKSVDAYAPAYGFYLWQSPEIAGELLVTDTLFLGEEFFRILFVPGHSPGHVAFYHEASGKLWSGDVLFKLSIGRTDLPGGNFPTLENSVKQCLYKLPPETLVFPGHGPETTIGFEMKENPFVPA